MNRLPSAEDPVVHVPAILRPLRSILLAVIDGDGRLREANQGFLDLLEPRDDAGKDTANDPRAVFINPTFNALWQSEANDSNEPICSGLMTLGNIDGEADTWLGCVYQRNGLLLLVCERDVAQDRNLRHQLLQLTDEYAQKERELARVHRELQHKADEIERLSLTDALTGLANRRHIDDLIQHELQSTARYGRPLAVMMLDIDRFKDINDHYGHQYGDEVLRSVSAVMAENARAADVLARWGGEEFLLLAPNTDTTGAAELAERIRSSIEATPMGKRHLNVTISIGVTEACKSDSRRSLVRRCDLALYRAKEAGRNRTVFADDHD